MQHHSAPKKTSRLKRIIVAERAEKAVAEASVSLQAAAQSAVTKMESMRELAEQLRVRTLTCPILDGPASSPCREEVHAWAATDVSNTAMTWHGKLWSCSLSGVQKETSSDSHGSTAGRNHAFSCSSRQQQ